MIAVFITLQRYKKITADDADSTDYLVFFCVICIICGLFGNFVAKIKNGQQMKKLILIMTVLGVTLTAQGQRVYELTAPAQSKTVKSGHLRMGGANPKGERIDVNSYYMTMAGRPVIPVMGEFHFSRYPAEQWEEEILKMKAGGISVIPTYVFWNIHEEQEAVQQFGGILS